jgi:hypothetical protein
MGVRGAGPFRLYTSAAERQWEYTNYGIPATGSGVMALWLLYELPS